MIWNMGKPMNNFGSAQDALSVRVRRALDDMAAIRDSLTGAIQQDGTKTEEPQNILDLELAAELKSVVDAMRQMLWAYIQALSAQSGRSSQQVMEWYKMELAVAMLRSARARSLNTVRPDTDQEYTLDFDKLYQRAVESSELHNKHQ